MFRQLRTTSLVASGNLHLSYQALKWQNSHMEMTLNLSEDQRARLVAISDLEGISLQEAVILAIEEAYSRPLTS